MATRTKATPQQLAFAVTAGHLDASTHTGRRAAARTCPTCRARVLVGDDSHLAALTATVDPQPITLPEEALALAAGRRTYTLRTLGTRQELSHRNARRAGIPAPVNDPNEYRASSGYVVVAEHACNADRRNSRNRRKGSA